MKKMHKKAIVQYEAMSARMYFVVFLLKTRTKISKTMPEYCLL